MGFHSKFIEKIAFYFQIDVLWNCLIRERLTTESAGEALKWLRLAVWRSNSTYRLMKNETAKYLFLEKLTKEIDTFNMSLEGYECYEKYFIFINSRDGNLELVNESFVFDVS